MKDGFPFDGAAPLGLRGNSQPSPEPWQCTPFESAADTPVGLGYGSAPGEQGWEGPGFFSDDYYFMFAPPAIAAVALFAY